MAKTKAKKLSGAKRSVSHSARKPRGAGGKDADLARDIVAPGQTLTTNQGLPISDDQNSLKAGVRGPTLLEDFHIRVRRLS